MVIELTRPNIESNPVFQLQNERSNHYVKRLMMAHNFLHADCWVIHHPFREACFTLQRIFQRTPVYEKNSHSLIYVDVR